MIERIFWSVPLSLAITTISSVLIGKFISLAAVVVFLFAISAISLAMLALEWRQQYRSGGRWHPGWQPLGGTALALAAVWIAVVFLSLVEFQRDHQLFLSLFSFDHSFRVNWTESILRTGIPPVNSIYSYKHPATMRNYYFWYVICAVVAQMSHLPVRPVINSSCVWAGFTLAALIGLYLKHFLAVGVHLRQQFVLAISLLSVTGLDICVNLWNLLVFQHASGDLEWWSNDPIYSWYSSVLWVPHHIASLLCCMLAFLLAWMPGKDGEPRSTASIVLIAAALASAFGLSIHVSFAFFLVMLAWGAWIVAIERKPQPALMLAAGGAGAFVLLLPYLWELTHTASAIHGASPFGFAVREMIPPESLLTSRLMQHLTSGHPLMSRSLANLFLLAPGYALELGFYFAVFLIYVVPAWRGRTPLNPAQRSLVFLTAVTIPVISLIRSSVLDYNEFGWRAAAVLQFPLLLLASELMIGWRHEDRRRNLQADTIESPSCVPPLLKSATIFALCIGAVSTFCEAVELRVVFPLAESYLRKAHDPKAGIFTHKPYILSVGYAQLDASIPRDAVVQFNPAHTNLVAVASNVGGINHQMVISGDKPMCGAELGGDPSGCPAMAAAIDALFAGASAEQARATCRHLGIDYLVATVYDPAWKNGQSWVWTLSPVVSDEEFRALDCRQ